MDVDASSSGALSPGALSPDVLSPCPICSRTFMPRSLEKHIKVCERAATKKRKPFDSAKQRIQGTDLAEFLPRQEKKRQLYEEKQKSSWKETHHDFIRTIRAARGRTVDTDGQAGQRVSSSPASSGKPMRANEKGTCPTCNRRFGVKAYERHVAWCKERSTRVPSNMPATNNVAKERLEARMKYRAPGLKNRRLNNRENSKFSHGSASTPNIVAATGSGRTSAPTDSVRSVASRTNLTRTARDTASMSDSHRIDKSRESHRSSASVTGGGEPSSRVSITMEATDGMDSTKRSSMDRPTSSSRSIGVPAPTTLRLPLCLSINRKKNESEPLGDDPAQRTTRSFYGDKARARRRESNSTIEDHGSYTGDRSIEENPTTGRKIRTLSSARSRKAKSRIINDVTNDVKVNENDLGMLVRPCNIYEDEDEFITWEKTSRDKSSCRSFDDPIKNETPKGEPDFELHIEACSLIEEETPPCDLASPLSFHEDRSIGNVAWSHTVRKLNRTYLIRDSTDREVVQEREIIDSPSIQFHSMEFDSNTVPPSCEDDLDRELLDEEEKGDFVPEDSRSLRRETTLSSEEKRSSRDESPPSMELELDLPENTCESKIEDDYKIETDVKDEESSVKSLKLFDEPYKSSIESDRATFESHEETIIDQECIEDPLPIASRPPDAGSSSESERSQPDDVSLDNISETDKRKVENDSQDSMEENNNGEEVCESIRETNSRESIACEADNVENITPKSVKAENMEIEVEETRSVTLSESRVKLGRPLPITIPIRRLNLIRIDSKIQKNMNLLRGSTDTLVSSVEAVEIGKRSKDNRSNDLHRNSTEEEEEESIDDRYGQNRYDKERILPEIKTDHRDTKCFRERSPKNTGRSYWEKASKLSRERSINNYPTHDYKQIRLRKRNPKIRVLPPVLVDQSPRIQRNSKLPRPLWRNYVRGRPDFNLVLRCRIGISKEYDPFLLAERQMHELLSDSSDLSTPTTVGSQGSLKSCYPLTRSSAFVEYPSRDQATSAVLDKRSTNKISRSEFDGLASDLSSDSTETNSLSREIFLRDFRDSKERDRKKEDRRRELGRRLILDKSIALGGEVVQETSRRRLEKPASKVLRSLTNKSQTTRACSAPKSIHDRNNIEETSNVLDNDRKNDYVTLSSSDLSLNSIVSSEVDIKRSNSVFDRSITSFEDDLLANDSFSSLRSFLRNESLQAYESGNEAVHPANSRQRYGNDRISDEEFSSPDNYRQQEQRFNADSAYSSLNRKSNYSNHGRGNNEDNSFGNNHRDNQRIPMSGGKTKCRMSRFCHECGSRFPETAKFCCECGIKRLAL